MSHGAQSAVMVLASSLIGVSSAGISTAALFACYTIGALAFTAPLTQALGARTAMVVAESLLLL